jgi:hypothetical protein
VSPTPASALAEQIRRILEQLDAGTLVAPTATRYRLEGALVALEAVAGEPSSLLALLNETDTDAPER